MTATDVRTASSARREVPALTAPRLADPPEAAERTLDSGLRVVAVRRAAVPLVELRLRIPFGGTDPGHAARAGVLAQALTSGTDAMTNVEIAAALQTVGGGVSVSSDPDRLLVSGNGLVSGLPRLLEVLTDVLTGAAYPEREVTTERERLADRVQMALSQPSHAVRRALLRRVYGDHPYGLETPDPDEIRGVDVDAVRALHGRRVLPAGSQLVLVGDVEPAAALDLVAERLSAWRTSGEAVALPPTPPLRTGPLLLVDRSGSVQSSIRLALKAVPRAHPDYAALQLANLVFGGYFSSRLVENIREDKGYTYSPHSGIDHSIQDSRTVVSADVATEVTAPALLEIGYELGRIAALPPSVEELEQARQYAIGVLALSVASQAGLAGMLAALAGSGLGLDWLAGHPRRLAAVTLAEVHAAAAAHLAPARAVTVVLGDADAVERPLAGLGEVVRG